MKPGKKFFLIVLACLAAILVAFALLRMKFGPFLPKVIDDSLPDVVMFAAVGVLLWNRKILGDEKKADAARKLEEEKAATSADADEESEPDAPH
jgi:phage tail protein X